MKTTRQSILAYLESKQIASSFEISRALNTTPANARHHLSILKEEGVVLVVGSLPARRRGRPTLLYALGEHTRQHNLGGLSSALLQEIQEHIPRDQLGEVMHRLASRLLTKPPASSSSLPQRLYQAVQQLNDMGYQSRWEAHAHAPRIILGHCPYAAILPRHPELCQLDAFIIEGLLESPAHQVDKLAKDQRGATFCKFIVGER